MLGGVYDRKIFIPGETRKNDHARRSLIEDGGLIALLQIFLKTDEEEIKSEVNSFIQNLDIIDY